MVNDTPPSYMSYNQANRNESSNKGQSNFVQTNFSSAPRQDFPNHYKNNTSNLTNGIPTVYTNGLNLYEQMVVQRQIILRQQQEYRQKMLEQNYPVKFVIGHAIFVVAICITLIALQIVMIINEYPLYYVGTGFWVSAYFIITISLSLLIIKKRNYCLFAITLIMNIFGIMIGFGGLIGVNGVSLSKKSECDSSFNVIFSYFNWDTTTTVSPNSCVFTYNYAQMGLVAAIFIACISFICATTCCMCGMQMGISRGGSSFDSFDRIHFGPRFGYNGDMGYNSRFRHHGGFRQHYHR